MTKMKKRNDGFWIIVFALAASAFSIWANWQMMKYQARLNAQAVLEAQRK